MWRTPPPPVDVHYPARLYGLRVAERWLAGWVPGDCSHWEQSLPFVNSGAHYSCVWCERTKPSTIYFFFHSCKCCQGVRQVWDLGQMTKFCDKKLFNILSRQNYLFAKGFRPVICNMKAIWEHRRTNISFKQSKVQMVKSLKQIQPIQSKVMKCSSAMTKGLKHQRE